MITILYLLCVVMTSILIVDNQDFQCELLATILKNNNHKVYIADTCKKALAMLSKENIDMVVLDVMMTTGEGLEVARQVTKRHFTPILMLTEISEEVSTIELFEAGADQCLIKPFSHLELLAQINSILRRQSLEKARYNPDQQIISVEQKLSVLPFTKTESRLIHYLIKQKDKVVSKKELQISVLKGEFSELDRNLDVHFSNIRRKLCQFGYSKNLILTVRNKGYSFETKESPELFLST